MKTTNTIELSSPVSGSIIRLADVNDAVFSKHLMGDGFAIKPTNGKIVSPISAVISFIAPTKHAVGLKTEDGLEIILHFGIDTVELNGVPFQISINEGDHVEKNTEIGVMNLKEIEASGKDTTVMLAITNTTEIIKEITFKYGNTTIGDLAASIEIKSNNKKIKKKTENDYPTTAKKIIEYVGGEENIADLIHCVTRLRFYLKDETKVDTTAMEQLDEVMGVVTAAGQYQVIIGPAVNNVYDAIKSNLSILKSGENKVADTPINLENQTTSERIKSSFNQLLGVITGSMTPIISILAASGIMKGLLALVTGINLVSDASNFYLIVSAMADSVFYFLPILIGFTAADRLGGNKILTAVIGGIIAYPSILEAADKGLVILSIGSFDFPYVSYSYSIFPMILAAWFVKKIEPWLKKKVPIFLQAIFNPIIIIGIVISITFLITGPVITWLSFALADGLQNLLSWNASIFGALIAGFYQLLVIFGLHWGIIPIYINDFATLGYSYLSAIVSVTLIGQGGAALAVAVKTKRAKLKEIGYAAAFSAFSGITEPAIYGITLRYRRPFLCACIGSAVGGFLSGLLHVNMWSIIGSIIGLPSFIDPDLGVTSNFWFAVLAGAATLIVSFVLTYFWGYNDSMEMKEKQAKPKNPAKMTFN